MQGTHEKPDPHLLTLHIIVLIIGSRAVTTVATPFRRVAEAHHARRSREASIEAPPGIHLRVHRFGFQRRHRADDPGGRPPMARAPRGEGPEVRLPGPGGVEVGHRVRVAALREVLVREQERDEEGGARGADAINPHNR